MILIISDYHKDEKAVLNLINKYHPDYILCCGDGESNLEFYEENNIIAVSGNCDFVNLPLVRNFELENQKIFMAHGHMHNVYFDIYKLYLAARECGAMFVFYGHTHMQAMETYDGITFVNPGALKDGNYAIMEDGKIILK